MTTEPNIKYRVTGAMVLIALAVIFLPLILDGQKKNQVLDSKIPDKPVRGEIILVNLDEEDSQAKAADEKTSSQTGILNKTEPTSTPDIIKQSGAGEISTSETQETSSEARQAVIKTVEKTATPPPTSDVKPETEPARTDRPSYKQTAYVIQLASLSNRENAIKLVDKLKSAGYKAYRKVGRSNGKTINRVLVGPELNKQDAESKIAALNKISGTKAIIMEYDPIRH